MRESWRCTGGCFEAVGRRPRGAGEDGGRMNEGHPGRLKGTEIPEVHGNVEGTEAEEGKCCEPEGKAVWGALLGEGRHAPGSCQVRVDIRSAEASQEQGRELPQLRCVDMKAVIQILSGKSERQRQI